MPATSSGQAAASAILDSLSGHAGHEERRLLEVLSDCPPDTLDAVVESPRFGEILSSTTERLFGAGDRSALIEMLVERRLGDLGPSARAALIRALARGATGTGDERAIAAVLLGTCGAALTAVKEAIDGSGDHRDLVHLVYRDIDSADRRGEILDHFTREAQARAGVKVLSDIDDTFYANWIDKRYPKKTVYPGVRQLYAELSCAPPEPASAVVTFITARPEDPFGAIEDMTHRTLAEHGVPRARVLSGAFDHLLTNASIAEEKLVNFDRYRKVFPEFGFVFFGDSGQGDVIFGQHIRTSAPELVPIVLIHDVVATPEERRAELRTSGIFLCDTYLGAAIAAFEAGLIPGEALDRVAAAVQSELATVTFASDDQRRAREEDLSRDLVRAAEVRARAAAG